MAFLGESGDLAGQILGPDAVDNQIRQALSLCWMMLPKDKKTISCLKAEIRRIVDRAFANLDEDAKAFGIDPDTPS